MNKTTHSVLDQLYLDAADDLLSSGGVKAQLIQDGDIGIDVGNKTSYVSVVCATGEDIAFSSMMRIDRDLLIGVHPFASADISERDLEDWCRELNNQLVGRMKNKLLRYDTVVTLGLPVLLTGTDLAVVNTPGFTVHDHFLRLGGGCIGLRLSTYAGPETQLVAKVHSTDRDEALAEGSFALF